jgi:hypothetical protein
VLDAAGGVVDIGDQLHFAAAILEPMARQAVDFWISSPTRSRRFLGCLAGNPAIVVLGQLLVGERRIKNL